MAQEQQLTLNVNTRQLLAGVGAAATALKGLDRVLSSISERLTDVFTVKGFPDYRDTVTRFGKDLADSLLVLQLAFGKLKYAIAEAVAPLASVFVPMLNSAIFALIRFAGMVGQFLRGVLAGVTGNQQLTGSAKETTRAYVKLGSAAKAAGKTVKRSLASFDQIERLNQQPSSGSGGGSGGSVTPWGGFQQDPISPGVQALVDQVLALLAPLMAIDLEPLRMALQTLWTSLSSLAAVVADGLEFLWYEILTPFAAWVMEKLAPVLTRVFAAGLDVITAALAPVMEGIRLLWEALKPVVTYIGSTVLLALQNWKQHFLLLANVFREKHPVIVGIFQNIAQLMTQLWTQAGPVLTKLAAHFGATFTAASQAVGLCVGYILDMLQGLTTFLTGAFSGDWKKAWEGIRLLLKSAVNGVITLLNAMISRLVSALNAVVRTANKLSFTVPEWVPSLGGKSFGVNLPTVPTLKIPYLAQGAVLPANKPFLAMVGDQRHGTNVEAPLTTIQEAVAAVMGDQVAAMMAGFNALLEENRRLRQVVEGVNLGDTTIGQAAERYQQSAAITWGV